MPFLSSVDSMATIEIQIGPSLTHLSLMEFPSLINWASPFPF